GLLGLLEADQAVAVGVDLPEQLLAADPLAPRHVAVAVAVHLAEPQRPLAALRQRPGRPGEAGDGDHLAAAPAAARGAAAGAELLAARDRAALDHAVAVAVQLLDQLARLAHLAHAQPAVAVAVEQVEQAAALVADRQRAAAGVGLVAPLLLLAEVGQHLLEVQLAVAVGVHLLEQAGEEAVAARRRPVPRPLVCPVPRRRELA